ncbi:DNA-directed RNA polymerase subunit beta [Oceanobacillus sp. Castelsardo]|uniref:DNA-directed RNA polymerase subunit beta n=1 Tax=Oceanobacillus sp. Castelsardo TaxID=1851204 RepID=UPI000839183D|nr:DNA-directed RNA polymerase subunit beta [Oceanobacillus sp. Castelsardo]
MSTEQLEKVAENPTTKEQKEKKNTAEKKPQKNNAETRKQHKEQKKQNKFLKFERPRRRMFPIWLRIIVVLSLALTALVVGLMVGYGVLGDGNPIDALKVDTWQHLIDIVMEPK